MKKRIVSSLLAFAILLPLCACKNSRVKEVEELITQIGEITKEISAEQEKAITAAAEGNNSLSDRDKEQVRIYDLLCEAKYKLEMSQIIHTMVFWNDCCDYAADAVEQIWTVKGADHVVGTLTTVLQFDDANKTVADYHTQSPLLSNFSEGDISIMLWDVAEALNPTEYSNDYYGKFEGKGEQGTIQICSQVCVAYHNIAEAQTYFSEAIYALKSEFSEVHGAEISQLVEWYIESDLYAGFAQEPSGSLSSYREAHNQFQKSVDRYQKMIASGL